MLLRGLVADSFCTNVAYLRAPSSLQDPFGARLDSSRHSGHLCIWCSHLWFWQPSEAKPTEDDWLRELKLVENRWYAKSFVGENCVRLQIFRNVDGKYRYDELC